LLTAAEEEGKRIARELHDSFGSRLAIINFRIAEVKDRYSQPELAEELHNISEETGELAKAAHDLSHALHLAAVTQLGLVAAVKGEYATFSKHRDIAVHFSAESVPQSLPEAVALCLYRVAQEALQNIRKHAGTKTASITLSGRGHTLVMVIEDLARVSTSKPCAQEAAPLAL
jgi:signal transduction histidine kinase